MSAFQQISTGSDTAIVGFSSRAAKPGRFELFDLRNYVPGLSMLLVSDPHREWFNVGLPGIGENIDDVTSAIETELAALNAERVITVGISMGGYAAILFACLLGAERAIALSPQTLLSPDLPFAPSASLSLQAPDLRPVIRSAPETRVDVVVGLDDLVDVFHVLRIADLESVRTLGIARRHHLFPVALARVGEFWPFLAALINDETPKICEDMPCDHRDLPRIAEAVFAMSLKDWTTGSTAIAPIAESKPDWAAPSYAHARALAHLADWSSAEIALETAVRANPLWLEPRILLAQSLIEQERPIEAEIALRRCLALKPNLRFGQALSGPP